MDARASRSKIILSLSAVDIAIGDSSVTDTGGGLIPAINQFEMESAAELWVVVRSARTTPQTVSYIEIYD